MLPFSLKDTHFQPLFFSWKTLSLSLHTPSQSTSENKITLYKIPWKSLAQVIIIRGMKRVENVARKHHHLHPRIFHVFSNFFNEKEKQRFDLNKLSSSVMKDYIYFFFCLHWLHHFRLLGCKGCLAGHVIHFVSCSLFHSCIFSILPSHPHLLSSLTDPLEDCVLFHCTSEEVFGRLLSWGRRKSAFEVVSSFQIYDGLHLMYSLPVVNSRIHFRWMSSDPLEEEEAVMTFLVMVSKGVISKTFLFLLSLHCLLHCHWTRQEKWYSCCCFTNKNISTGLYPSWSFKHPWLVIHAWLSCILSSPLSLLSLSSLSSFKKDESSGSWKGDQSRRSFCHFYFPFCWLCFSSHFYTMILLSLETSFLFLSLPYSSCCLALEMISQRPTFSFDTFLLVPWFAWRLKQIRSKRKHFQVSQGKKRKRKKQKLRKDMLMMTVVVKEKVLTKKLKKKVVRRSWSETRWASLLETQRERRSRRLIPSEKETSKLFRKVRQESSCRKNSP